MPPVGLSHALASLCAQLLELRVHSGGHAVSAMRVGAPPISRRARFCGGSGGTVFPTVWVPLVQYDRDPAAAAAVDAGSHRHAAIGEASRSRLWRLPDNAKSCEPEGPQGLDGVTVFTAARGMSRTRACYPGCSYGTPLRER